MNAPLNLSLYPPPRLKVVNPFADGGCHAVSK
nr:MAG TPA: hypothetical protein [Caudoviricetes sp.]